MARSHNIKQSARADDKKPPNWTDLVPHKYCGALDYGRKGKSNKSQKCAACMEVKAQHDHATEKATKDRRSDKMQFSIADDW
ncbi:transporter protein [Ophiostoma piceae UAMH 11346]|uniref:Transporter protein n=1 Tax=Ophiostoma piceae (strain UAMH 11346) TaxID=1262450 RepID=S3BVC1_OPHP1|nr:transporter protein [Ophiostoma piceae UAMH 11346]